MANPRSHSAFSEASSVVGTGTTRMTKSDLIQHLAEKKKMTWQHAEVLVEAVFARGDGVAGLKPASSFR